MAKQIIALLPLDDRPVNYDYPGYLARLGGCALHLPPRDWLGNPWRESQHIRLVKWLEEAAASADALIVAVDTLAYGGLIPSRRSREPLPQMMDRLDALKQIKAKRPGLPVLAFSVIQRISRDNSSEEEKEYWATYGSAMFRLSYLEHLITLGETTPDEASEGERLRRQIPGEVYGDYLEGRRRNHAVNRAMLDWLEEGIFDYLLLPQDDTADYGWNIAEARHLQAEIRRRGLSEQAITYPGADEIGCLLLAAFLCRQAGFKPRVFPRYSSIHSPQVVTAYEDRPIHELLKAHLAPLAGHIASSPEEADLTLFINAPSRVQGDGMLQWIVWSDLPSRLEELPESQQAFFRQALSDPHFQNTRQEMETPHRSAEELTRLLWSEVMTGRPAALADVAFVNGADLALGDLMARRPEVVQLYAYGGWNTAGNTLGTVLAHASLRLLAERRGLTAEQEQAHLGFLFLRLLDDYGYQARVRSQAWLEDLPALGLPLDSEHLADPQAAAALDERVRQRLQEVAARLEALFKASRKVERIEVTDIHLPWQRLFEVAFDVQVTLAPQTQEDQEEASSV